MYQMLAILAAFVMVYSIVAGRIERSWISGPIIFTLFGVIAGPLGLNWLSFEGNPEVLMGLAEMTLALVLFTDAAGADLGVLRRSRRLPLRLLAIGLPLTLLLGFGAGMLIFGTLTVFELALLATMLAPTDAALGKAVVTNEQVPDAVRQGLNVESGLNDGICVPVLTLFLALAVGHSGEQSVWEMGLQLITEIVGIGLLTGVVVTGVAAVLLRFCLPRQWLSHTWSKILVVAIALTCFGTAQALGGSGFIASFVGGLLFGGMLKLHKEELLGSAEGIGDTFALMTWVLFGAVVVAPAMDQYRWQVLLYAVLSLTVIRMLPVFVAVAGMGISTEGKLFLGWFGPRGLASIVFAVIVIHAEVPHSEVIAAVVVCTIFLSILAHGVSANPWARAFGARMRLKQQGSPPVE